jgi:hypothetical protein
MPAGSPQLRRLAGGQPVGVDSRSASGNGRWISAGRM